MKTYKVLIIVVTIIFCVANPSVTLGTKMYWVDLGTTKIQRANLDGSNVEDLVTGVYSFGIDVDPSSGKMYWTDCSTRKIQRANLDGSNVEDLATGLASPWGIALDLDRGKMYWGDDNGNIRRANLDGSNIEKVLTDAWPVDIAVNSTAGKIYWTDYFAGAIWWADLDGSNVQYFVPGFSCGIALDMIDKKVYWTDFEIQGIRRANLDGSDIEDLVAGREVPIGIAIDPFSGVMRWTETDWSFTKTNIWGANLDGTNIIGPLVKDLYDLVPIAIPEPTTVLLMGLGGLVLRRKHG